jgi:hypothetical protein
MVDEIKIDGGPAFPNLYKDGTGLTVMPIQGMSLRDYFAGQALGSCIERAHSDFAARLAYEVADAMLKERSKS